MVSVTACVTKRAVASAGGQSYQQLSRLPSAVAVAAALNLLTAGLQKGPYRAGYVR